MDFREREGRKLIREVVPGSFGEKIIKKCNRKKLFVIYYLFTYNFIIFLEKKLENLNPNSNLC